MLIRIESEEGVLIPFSLLKEAGIEEEMEIIITPGQILLQRPERKQKRKGGVKLQ